MSTLFSIFMLIFIVWLTLKIVPAIFGFTFSLILAILQVLLIILLLPVLEILCFLFDAILIFLIITLFKVIL